MRKSIVLSILVLLTSVSIQAKHITSSEALQLAFHKTSCRAAKAMSAARYQLAYTADGFYAYNKSIAGGFVILAADDCVSDMVLGYADNGTFDYSTMPDAMKEWLDQINREVTQLSAIEAKYPNRVSSSLDTLATIDPLVKCKWDQGSPYNLMAPTSSDGSHYAAGCVAVAMAQVMSCHKWPESYDWANMSNTYGSTSTTEQNNAVAKLMLDCSVSVDSKYTSGGTTANIAQVVPAFVKSFDYDKSISHVKRALYTKREWRDLLYNNLAQGMPIYYRGSSSDGGHAFVCDGYKDGLFHINWGWSGMSDGYFQIALLEPAEQGTGGSTSGYQFEQEAVINIKPNAGGEMEHVMYCAGTFTPGSNTVSITSKAFFYGVFENEAYDSINVNLGIKLEDATGNIQYIASSNLKNQTVSSLDYLNSMTIQLSEATLTEGTYIITPVYQECGKAEWKEMRVNKTVAYQYVIGTVGSDGKITFSKPKFDADINVTSIKPRTRIIAGYDTDIDYSIACTRGEYLRNVYVAFLNSGTTKVVSKSSKGFVDLTEGEDFSYSSSIKNPTTAGKYDLVVLDEDGVIISDRDTITVEEAPSGELALKGSLITTSKAIDDLKFKLHLQCTSGVFNSKITVFIYTSGFDLVGSIPGTSRTFLVEGDDAVDIYFSGAFDMNVDSWYTAYAYYANPSWIEIAEKTFRSAAPSGTGIDDIQCDAKANSETYNIVGQKVNCNSKGIVIRRGRKYLNR